MALTKKQERRIRAAYESLLAIVYIDLNKKSNKCSAFDKEPFHTHWDDRTVKEIYHGLKIYLDSWVTWKLEEVLGVSQKETATKLGLVNDNEDKYPLIKEGYDALPCITCDTLCYPDAQRADGSIIYNRHKCRGTHDHSFTFRSFEIDPEGNLVEEL